MWISFGDVARNRCGMQSQYCSRYVDGFSRFPKLGEGLRFQGSPFYYHSLEIHADDADEFVARVKAHRTQNGIGWSGE